MNYQIYQYAYLDINGIKGAVLANHGIEDWGCPRYFDSIEDAVAAIEKYGRPYTEYTILPYIYKNPNL